jgi:hypothetical protein
MYSCPVRQALQREVTIRGRHARRTFRQPEVRVKICVGRRFRQRDEGKIEYAVSPTVRETSRVHGCRVRSRAGYLIGGGLVVAGVIGAVLWFATSLMRLGDEVDNFQRVSVPGKTTMKLEAHKYVVYYEGSAADQVVPPVRIAITDAKTGSPLAIAPYGGSLTYSASNHEGSALGTVTPAHAGIYAVRTDRNVRASGAKVALGRSLTWPILRGILGMFVIGGLLAGGGVVLLIITAVRRSRAPRAPS